MSGNFTASKTGASETWKTWQTWQRRKEILKSAEKVKRAVTLVML
jgi:hypothetical protein